MVEYLPYWSSKRRLIIWRKENKIWPKQENKKNEESQKNITNLMEQIEKLYQKLNEKNSEIEDLHQRNLILKICCGIFGGFIFITLSLWWLYIIRKLLNTNCNTGTCRYRNGAKNRDTSYTNTGTDSYNTHDKATEKDSLCDDINTEGHREENHATEQTLLQVTVNR